jgi:hypothetical protein
MLKHDIIAGNVAVICDPYRYTNLLLVDFSISWHDFAFSGHWRWLRLALDFNCVSNKADEHLHGSDQLRYNRDRNCAD